MKLLKKITTAAFLTFGLSAIAQDNARLDVIKDIADKSIANCTAGPQNMMDLDQKGKENMTLYAEYYKQNDYKMAIKFWRPLFFNAPKTSANLHLRGLNIYKAFADEAEGDLKLAYLDTIFAIHESRIACYGFTSKIVQSKAFDWYSYRLKGNEAVVYDIFNNTHKAYIKEGSENDADPSFLLYWAKIAIKADKIAHSIDSDEVLDIFETISNIADANMEAGKDAGSYKGALDEVTEEMKSNGYLDATKILELSAKKFEANPNDENTLIKAYKGLRACGSECTDSKLFSDVVKNLAKVRPSVVLYKYLAAITQKEGKNSEAIGYLNKAIELETEKSEKSALLYKIAQVHFSAGSFSNARDYARRALDINPNFGEAYILIGSTYASSGSICGTGNDFKSHTVSWAAIDTWQKAKNVDSSVADEAQRLINKYSQYMPSKEELFYEGISIGSTYTISCLGVTTIVRASN